MKHLFTLFFLFSVLILNAACSIIINQTNEDFPFQGTVEVTSDLGTVTLDPDEEEVIVLVEGSTVITYIKPVISNGGDVIFGEFEENGAAFMNAEPDVSGTIYSDVFPSDCVACSTIINMSCEADGDPTTLDRFDDMCNCVAAAFLPVELTFFDVRPTDNGNELAWITASETNNEKFEIQRSYDGVNWRVLGSVAGAGDSYDETRYTYIDKKQPYGDIYYRLKQIDFDGNFELSNVVSLQLVKNEVLVYPNPSGGHFFVDYPREIQGDLEIFDRYNTLLFSTPINGAGRIELDISQLPSGIYFVTDSQTFAEEVIINPKK